MAEPTRPAPEKLISGTTAGVFIYNIDKASVPNMIFIGLAEPGIAGSAVGWKIMVIDKTTSVTKIRFAEGDVAFRFIWDNRLGLSYS